ncbi:MAG: mevalonate kinase [Candidatus Aenigmatarchaeota archaeon]
MVKVSTPGKVHLIGEHAVVYNKPAIIAAIGKRVFIEAEKLDSDTVKIDYIQGNYQNEVPLEEVLERGKKAQELWEQGNEKGDFSEIFAFCKDEKFAEVSIGYAMRELGIKGGASFRMDQQIPLGSGLGSSSAYSVAITFAIAKLFGLDVPLERINEIAYGMEKFKHGKPSGGDNSTCCFGGLVWFVKGTPPTIKSLREEVPYSLENFVLVYSEKPQKTTGELVQHVMGLDEGFRNARMDAIEKDTHQMLEALKAKDFEKMKELINNTHKNLAELGVSTPAIERIVEAVRGIGGAAKLCGAGGGGIVLCWHADKEKLIETIKGLGFEPWETDLAVEGAKVEA